MAEEDKSDKPTRDLGKLLGMGILVINLAVIGLGTYLTYSATLGYKSKYITEEDLNQEIEEFRKSLQGEAVFYQMNKVSTNLNGIPRRMIRVEVNLEMLDEEGFEEVIRMNAESRDAVIRILNSRTFPEIETLQGKLHLKNEIITALNSLLDNGIVKNVYFSEFSVQ